MHLTVAEIADIVGGRVTGDGQVPIHGVAVFETATTEDITYVDSPRFLKKMAASRAGAVIVPEHFNQPAPCPVILTDNPKLGFARILAVFHPDKAPPPASVPMRLAEKIWWRVGMYPLAILSRWAITCDWATGSTCIPVCIWEMMW